jgi:hypothetical protein
MILLLPPAQGKNRHETIGFQLARVLLTIRNPTPTPSPRSLSSRAIRTALQKGSVHAGRPASASIRRARLSIRAHCVRGCVFVFRLHSAMARKPCDFGPEAQRRQLLQPSAGGGGLALSSLISSRRFNRAFAGRKVMRSRPTSCRTSRRHNGMLA